METSHTNIDEMPVLYDVAVESVKVSQLNIGDFINIKTKSGSKYVFRVDGKGKDEEGEKIFVKCVSGPEKMRDSTGRVKTELIKKDEKFKYGSAGTSNIQEIVISKTPIIVPVSKIEYNVSIFELDAGLLEKGHVIYAETNSGSIYILEVVEISEISGRPFVKIIGGNNSFMGDMGVLRNMVLGVGLNLKTDMMTSTPLKLLEIRRSANTAKGLIETRDAILHEVQDLTDPEAQMSGIIFVNLTMEEKKTLETLKLPSMNITKGMLKSAWQRYLADYGKIMQEAKINPLIRIKYRHEVDHEIIRIGYESLLTRLGEVKQEEK